jgi:MFS family permease
VLLMSLVTAILYGVLYLLITSIPFIFGPRYDFSAKSTGLVYLALGLGMMLALFVCGRYSDRIVKERRRALVTNDKASSPSSSGIPEQRLTLLLTIPGTVCTVCGLLLYGWTAEHRLHWTAPVSGLLLFGFGLIMITSPISIYMIECFLQNAASAMAATMFLRSVIAGLMPLSGLDLYDKFGVGYGTTILAGLAAGASGLVFLCRFHGPSIRKKFPVKL